MLSMSCCAETFRSFGSVSVSEIWPDEPESMRAISGCCPIRASAFARSGAAASGVVTASVWIRTLRRLRHEEDERASEDLTQMAERAHERP